MRKVCAKIRPVLSGLILTLTKGEVELLVGSRIMEEWKPPVQITSGVFSQRASQLPKLSLEFTGCFPSAAAHMPNPVALRASRRWPRTGIALLAGFAEPSSELYGSLFVAHGLFV